MSFTAKPDISGQVEHHSSKLKATDKASLFDEWEYLAKKRRENAHTDMFVHYEFIMGNKFTITGSLNRNQTTKWFTQGSSQKASVSVSLCKFEDVGVFLARQRNVWLSNLESQCASVRVCVCINAETHKLYTHISAKEIYSLLCRPSSLLIRSLLKDRVVVETLTI